MDPSSTLCWLQEAYHRDRAVNSDLENVRRVAERAAKAWEIEALAAERREARHTQVRTISNLQAAKKRDARENLENMFSENPDQGFADA